MVLLRILFLISGCFGVSTIVHILQENKPTLLRFAQAGVAGILLLSMVCYYIATLTYSMGWAMIGLTLTVLTGVTGYFVDKIPTSMRNHILTKHGHQLGYSRKVIHQMKKASNHQDVLKLTVLQARANVKHPNYEPFEFSQAFLAGVSLPVVQQAIKKAVNGNGRPLYLIHCKEVRYRFNHRKILNHIKSSFQSQDKKVLAQITHDLWHNKKYRHYLGAILMQYRIPVDEFWNAVQQEDEFGNSKPMHKIQKQVTKIDMDYIKKHKHQPAEKASGKQK